MIKECRIHGSVEHFIQTEKGKIRWRCRQCTAIGVSKHRNAKKLWCVQKLGGKCMSCGYSKFIGALEFHHRDPSQKEFSFNSYPGGSYERLEKELMKCDLLCANCHREAHAGM